MDVSPAGFLHNDHSPVAMDTGEPNASFFAPLFESTLWACIFIGINMRINRIIRTMMQRTASVFSKGSKVGYALSLCQVFCWLTTLAVAQTPSNQMVDGKKEGAWTYYFDNGKVSAIENFRNGLLEGAVEYFYPNGVRQGLEHWHNGAMEDSATYWHQNGKIDKKGKYERGQYAGEWNHYFENGKPERIVNYVNGLPNGPTRSFYENGGLSQEGSYKDGKEDGEWKFYNEQGDLEYIGTYRDGKEIKMKRIKKRS